MKICCLSPGFGECTGVVRIGELILLVDQNFRIKGLKLTSIKHIYK